MPIPETPKLGSPVVSSYETTPNQNDIAYLNQEAQKLPANTQDIDPEKARVIANFVDAIEPWGYLPEKILEKTYSEVTGVDTAQLGPDKDYQQLRSALLFDLLCREAGYKHFDETRLVSNVSDAFRRLASKDLGLATGPFLTEKIGAKVAGVQVDTGSRRIYLKLPKNFEINAANHAVLYYHPHEDGDSWKLGFPFDGIELEQSGLPPDPGSEVDSAARELVDLFEQILALPEGEGTLLEAAAEHTGMDLSPKERAFMEKAVAHMYQMYGHEAPKVEQAPVVPTTLSLDNLTASAWKVVGEFRDGNPSWIAGTAKTDLDMRAELMSRTEAQLRSLIGFVKGGDRKELVLKQFAALDHIDRGGIMRADKGLGSYYTERIWAVQDGDIERKEVALDNLPAGVQKYVAANTHEGETMLGFAHNYTKKATTLTRAREVSVCGKSMGYLLTFQTGSWSEDHVVDKSGSQFGE